MHTSVVHRSQNVHAAHTSTEHRLRVDRTAAGWDVVHTYRQRERPSGRLIRTYEDRQVNLGVHQVTEALTLTSPPRELLEMALARWEDYRHRVITEALRAHYG